LHLNSFYLIRYDIFFLCSFFFFSSRRRHTRLQGDWSSDVCSSDLLVRLRGALASALYPSHVDVVQRAPSVDRFRPLFPRSASPRSEERRVGKECRARWGAEQCEKKR